MHVRLTTTPAEEGAVPVRARVQVIDVMLVRFRTTDRALPTGGRTAALGASHLVHRPGSAYDGRRCSRIAPRDRNAPATNTSVAK